MMKFIGVTLFEFIEFNATTNLQIWFQNTFIYSGFAIQQLNFFYCHFSIGQFFKLQSVGILQSHLEFQLSFHPFLLPWQDMKFVEHSEYSVDYLCFTELK